MEEKLTLSGMINDLERKKGYKPIQIVKQPPSAKIKKTQTNPLLSGMVDNTRMAYTENGALTHSTTHSALLDLFSLGGAMRHRSESDLTSLVDKAVAEDLQLTLKILFYLRDIRGGQGERRIFRVALEHLYKYYADTIIKLIPVISEYGRFDDIIYSIGCIPDVYNYIKCQPNKSWSNIIWNFKKSPK